MNIPKRSPLNNNLLSLPYLPQLTQPTQQTQIINPYTQQLKQLFSIPQSIPNNIDTIINLISKVQLHFLLDLQKKMHCEDYKQFLKGLILVKKECGDNIIQKNKKGSYQYILFQGLLSYNIKQQAQQQQTLIKIGTGYSGFGLYPQIYMPWRHVNLTITCLTSCYLLSISEELYTKYLKKLSIKQTDKLCQFLAQMPIFSGIGPINIRKYLVFFIPRCYRYNQIIYEQKQRNQYQKNNKEEIYFILKGSVQIYENTKHKCLNVVTLGYRECFGLQITNQKFCVKSKDNHLQVLVLHKNILQMIKYQNPIVSQNFVSFLNKLNKLHCTIIKKNLKISDSKQKIPTKICKKKKKKQRKVSHSLKWWGIAQNIKLQQKYKMPSSPKLTSCGYKSALQQNKSNRISLMTHKINRLKRRILEGDQMYDDKHEDQENIDKSHYQNNNYAPKIKARIRIIEARPKFVDMAQNMKKKLVNYAKNMGSFCDRLNLQ